MTNKKLPESGGSMRRDLRNEIREALREIWNHLPKTSQNQWFYQDEPIVQVSGQDITVGAVYRRKSDGLAVLVSLDGAITDDVRWLHVSASFPDKIPTWDDMCNVKDTFIGADKYAIQIHPPQSEYVNHHPFTLHLWHNVKGKTVPDEGFDRMETDRIAGGPR